MSRNCLTAFAAVLALAASSAAARNAQVFYCSTSGSDSNPGTEAQPFKTPAYAIAQANTAGDEVRFAPGTYDIDSTIALGHNDITLTGTAARDVIFDANNACRILVADVDNKSYSGIVISGITFRNGRHSSASDYWAQMKTLGGAVRLTGTTNAGEYSVTGSVVTNCAFENCSSDYGGGGALFVAGGSTVVDCSFANCSGGLAGKREENQQNNPGGGALNANTATADVLVLRCSFTGNVCSNGVGAVASTASNLQFATNSFSMIIRDCGFTNNVSYGYAGCLGLKARIVENCTFKGNECRKSNLAMDRGVPRNSGGVFAPESRTGQLVIPQTVLYSGCRFEDNDCLAGVNATGGGVFHTVQSVLIMATNCVFKGNSSASLGNVYYGDTLNDAGGLVMADCVVSGSHPADEGTDTVYQRRCTILHGDSSKTGILRILRTKFIGNANVGAAGEVFASAPETEIVDCEFRGNSVSRCGFAPATVNFYSSATNSILRGCLFAANTNYNAGGSSVRFGAQGNSAGTTGGMNCTVESCTFAGNRWSGTSYTDQSGAVNFRDSVEGAVIRNCVFWDNHSTASDTLRSFSTAKGCADIAQYCWEDGSQLATGARDNIAGGTTPNFLDAANGVWIPTAKSPWVNKGQYQAWMAGAFDLRNDRHFPRIYNGSVDMGCYEYAPLFRPTILSVR